MRSEPLPWELPGAHWMGREEEEMVLRVIKAKSPFRYYGLNLQRMVEKLEKAYCKRTGRLHALGVSSGTAALNIAFGSIGVGPGDEVLVPGYLWVSCLSSVVRLGAIPKLVDIDRTFTMCPKDMSKKTGPRTKAVLYVHMSGAPGRIEEVARIAKAKDLKLVEDCAQANGAALNGRPVGSFGDMAIYSFQLNKNMTSGEGGMIVCDDETLYKRAFAMHDLGYARNEAGRLDPSDGRYQLWGVGARMSELTAAMALAQNAKLNRITASMRRSKWSIRKAISGIKGLSFREILDPSGDSGPFLIFMLDDPDTSVKFVEALRAEGIRGNPGSLAVLHMKEWGLHWYFNNQSLVKKRSWCSDGFPWTHPANKFAERYDYSKGALPFCDEMSERAALLTIASNLTRKDVSDIIRAFKKVASGLRIDK